MQKEAFADTSCHFIYSLYCSVLEGNEEEKEEISVLLSVDHSKKTLGSFIFENILQLLMAIFGIIKIGRN